MKTITIGLGALALVGCTQDRPAATPAPVGEAQACNVDKLQGYVGQPATPELLDKVRRESHSATARRITPEMRVTMEFRADRVNIWVGLKGEAERINCG